MSTQPQSAGQAPAARLAHGITRVSLCRASGPQLLADNDEPEPGDLTPADLAEIDEEFRVQGDLAYNELKNSGELFRQEVRRAERLERLNPQQGAWR